MLGRAELAVLRLRSVWDLQVVKLISCLLCVEVKHLIWKTGKLQVKRFSHSAAFTLHSSFVPGHE